MTTFTVTSTSDNATDPGSFRSALNQAQNSPGAVIAFSLPANSTIFLGASLPNPTVGQIYDFTGAPGLMIGSASGVAYSIVRDVVSDEIYGVLNVAPSGGNALLLGTGASAILHGSAQLISATTQSVGVSDGGASLVLESGARISTTGRNAIDLYDNGGQSNQTVTIASGATVSNTTATNGPAIYVESSTTGAIIANAGTISSVGGNAIQLNSNATLMNTGTISTGAGTFPAVFFSGTANSIISSGTISAPSSGSYAISGSSASGTVNINLQTGSNTTGNVGGNVGAAYVINLAGTLNGAIFGGTANDSLTLNTSANLSGVSAINLGGGTDTLILDGSGASALNDALVSGVEALIKNGAGVWTLNGTASFNSVALNLGLLEVATAGAGGTGPITFATGAQTLQIDGRTAGGAFEDTLAQLGAGDQVDVRGIGSAASAVVSGNTLLLRNAAGATIYTLNVDSGASLSAFQISVAPDSANGTVLSVSGVGGGVTSPTPPPVALSVQQGFGTEVQNLIRVSAADPALGDPRSPLYGQAQGEISIASRVDAGQLGLLDAQNSLYHLVDGTTSVAEISYAFFAGKTPTAAGLNYLVHSSSNTTDLNDAYYAQFTTENRYINFANSLATGQGAGAAAFQANYGSLSLNDATAKAYTAVFGITPTADKVSAILNAQVSNGVGGTETRAQYFLDITGGSTISQKAAVVGFLLADSVKEGFGAYQQADLHFLADLAHGSAVFNVDLLAAYGTAPSLVGQPVVDPTLGS